MEHPDNSPLITDREDQEAQRLFRNGDEIAIAKYLKTYSDKIPEGEDHDGIFINKISDLLEQIFFRKIDEFDRTEFMARYRIAQMIDEPWIYKGNLLRYGYVVPQPVKPAWLWQIDWLAAEIVLIQKLYKHDIWTKYRISTTDAKKNASRVWFIQGFLTPNQIALQVAEGKYLLHFSLSSNVGRFVFARRFEGQVYQTQLSFETDGAVTAYWRTNHSGLEEPVKFKALDQFLMVFPMNKDKGNPLSNLMVVDQTFRMADLNESKYEKRIEELSVAVEDKDLYQLIDCRTPADFFADALQENFDLSLALQNSESIANYILDKVYPDLKILELKANIQKIIEENSVRTKQLDVYRLYEQLSACVAKSAHDFIDQPIKVSGTSKVLSHAEKLTILETIKATGLFGKDSLIVDLHVHAVGISYEEDYDEQVKSLNVLIKNIGAVKDLTDEQAIKILDGLGNLIAQADFNKLLINELLAQENLSCSFIRVFAERLCAISDDKDVDEEKEKYISACKDLKDKETLKTLLKNINSINAFTALRLAMLVCAAKADVNPRSLNFIHGLVKGVGSERLTENEILFLKKLFFPERFAEKPKDQAAATIAYEGALWHKSQRNNQVVRNVCSRDYVSLTLRLG